MIIIKIYMIKDVFMKRFVKISLSILLAITIAAGAFCFWQRDNISALIRGTQYSSEELASQLDVKREELKTKLDKYTSLPITDLTAEDEQKLFKGEITVEEVSEKYKLPLNVMKEENKKETDSVTNDGSVPPTDNSEALDKVISDSVSKLYALKAKYVTKLGELERTIYNEYTSLPKEKQNASSKKEIVTKNLKYIADMEQKCDNEVEAVLSALEKELIELKGDTEIIGILNESYKNEKELKKSYYISIYND